MAHPVDNYVGRRIRERRTALGLTQADLAKQIGVTYQQQHKYEHGVNRVSASKLYEIAQALGVEIGFFFEGLGNGSQPLNPRQRMQLEVARNFAAIRRDEQRAAVRQLCRALAG